MLVSNMDSFGYWYKAFSFDVFGKLKQLNMISNNSLNQHKLMSLRHFIKYLLVSLIVYWVINFKFTPNTLSPIHQDDYLMLGAGYENFRWMVERPISTMLVNTMGQMGSTFSFILINLLTAVIPALVLYFVAQLLRIKFGWLTAIAFSVMVFSHPAAFEHGKYLGLITNLSSHFFGSLALIGLLYARRNPRLTNSAFAVITYGLSVFAKEDFLLPPLLLLIYFGAGLYYWSENREVNAVDDSKLKKKWFFRIALWFVVLAAASIFFGLLVRNPFVAGAVGKVGGDAHYAVSFSPSVLVSAFLKLTIEYSRWQTFAGIFSGIVLVVLWKDRRRELFLLALIIFSLIVPYALISNHVFLYRVFAWLPWFSALAVVGIPFFWRCEIGGLAVRRVAKVFASALFIASFLIGYLDSSSRLMVASWYELVQRSNKQMVDSIISYRTLLAKEDVVGVVGIEGLSPWSNNDGSYLRKKLGFENRWIVFVDKSTIFFTIRDLAAPAYLSISSSRQICDHPDLLLMKFDSSGLGIPIRAGELCNSREVLK